MTNPKRVLILFSDTGGGHRAAAEAIRDALLSRHGEALKIEMVDVFRDYTPFPYKYAPELYPWFINKGKGPWSFSYELTNGDTRARMIIRGMYASSQRSLKRMYQEHPADIIVCVHSVLAQLSMNALEHINPRPAFITVVTDLVSTHAFWYDSRVERCLVPTEAALERGVKWGLRRDQMRVTGLPVHPDFSKRLKAKSEARAELGWDKDLPAILMVGGGEGMGPLYQTARAVNDQKLKCQLVIIAGRNQSLKQNLENAHWNQPTHVYPFVTNMPVLMAAADVLVTKGGPATICEACIAGLPLIIYDAIPGQETGNVEFVVDNDAGLFAPGPDKVAAALKSWLAEGPEGLARRSKNAHKIAKPDAVWTIAEEIWDYLQRPLINNPPSQRRLAQFELDQLSRQATVRLRRLLKTPRLR